MRLIDADELTEMVWRERLDTRERIANLIARQPTIEGAVKRGKWKYYKNNRIINTYICTNCQGKVKMAIDVEPSSFKYCPNCGANMRGDKSNA